VLYQWSTAIGGLVQDAIVLALVLAIAGFSARRLALRRPLSYARAAGLVATAIVVIYLFEVLYTRFVHTGNEQGLTPSHWEPAHAAAYVANGIVICTWVPFVEELTYRGLGYSLLERYGRWPAILVVGLMFGLAHGLLVSLPIIVAFGCVLAWVRARTDSVFPGMFLHALFNLIAIVAAVTIGG
jgi:membrane protease YdiL (CAAX protease family)